jgi:hypothetical protein
MLHQIFLGWSNQWWNGLGMKHACRRREMHAQLWSENQKGRDHSENLVVDVKILLEWILGKQGVKVWTGCIWLRIRTSDGALVNTVMNIRALRRGISWVVK